MIKNYIITAIRTLRLGATVTQIVSLLSKDFVKLVGIALVIAIPIAWYATHRWMENFAYWTTINWWVYALSGLDKTVSKPDSSCIKNRTIR